MTTQAPLPPSAPAAAAGFCTTRWTQVSLAKADSPCGRTALSELCEAYYEPVSAFLRCTLRDTDEVQEVAQEFFAGLLAGGAIDGAERGRGRFRSYVLGAVKHFLSHRREAATRLKRGGGRDPLELEAAAEIADPRDLSPDLVFDRKWAATVLERALRGLEKECTAEGKAELLAVAKPWLAGEAEHGDQAIIAQSAGLSAGAFKAAVHRLKRRFRHLVKAEIAETLQDPAMVDDEMAALMAALND